MPAPSARAGMTLVELLVASLLLLVVLAIGSLAARRTLGLHHDLALADDRAAALGDALATLERHLAGVRSTSADLRVARDTALEFTHDIGVTITCRSNRDTLLLGTADDTVPWSAHLPRAITTDDELQLWSDGDTAWRTVPLRAVTPASLPCTDSLSAPLGNAIARVVIGDTSLTLRSGAVAIVRQRERWSLVRGGDGQWSLSMATWDATTRRFVAPQPMLTPLAAPNGPDGAGLAVRAVDAAGVTVPDSALASAVTLIVTLRTARQARLGVLTASVRINVQRH